MKNEFQKVLVATVASVSTGAGANAETKPVSMTPAMQSIGDSLVEMKNTALESGVACLVSYKDDGQSPAPDFLEGKLKVAFDKRAMDFNLKVLPGDLPGYSFPCFTPYPEEPMGINTFVTND